VTDLLIAALISILNLVRAVSKILINGEGDDCKNVLEEAGCVTRAACLKISGKKFF
jgi:hypothetical protein